MYIPCVSSMTGVVKVNHITCLTLLRDLLIRLQDILLSRVGILSIVEEQLNILVLETMHILKIFHHIQGIILTSRKFTILTNVVYSNKDGALGTVEVIRSDIKLGIDVKVARGGELRDLVESLLFEDVPHLEKYVLEGKILIRLLLVGVEDFEDC